MFHDLIIPKRFIFNAFPFPVKRTFIQRTEKQFKTFFVFYLLYSTLLHTFVAVHTGKALLVGTFY
ncbi:MAG TPA: hypothetical protein DCZ45_17990 [Parabacteroides goldsteinii]|nr:hypothetical protein DWW91_24640 [Parabacteroides sp. AF17-3]HBA32454.1 hypothetical protein [Parabacteroides goldsteinii]